MLIKHLKFLLLFFITFLSMQSCNKRDYLNHIENESGISILKKWKESVLKLNPNIISTNQIDSIIKLIDVENYQNIELDTSKLILYKNKNDNSLFGIKVSQEKYSTLGVFRSENRSSIDLSNDIVNIFNFKKLDFGIKITKYNLKNFLESTYSGLYGNILKETTIVPIKSTQTNNSKNIKTLSTTCIDWYWVTYLNGVEINREYVYTTCDNAAMDLPGDNYGGSAADTILNIDPCILASAHKQTYDSLKNSTDYTNKLNILAQPSSVEMTTTFGRNSNGQIISTSIGYGNSISSTPDFNISDPFALLHSHPNISPPSTGDFYSLAKNANLFPTLSASISIDSGGNMYSLLIVDRKKLSTFYSNNPSEYIIVDGKKVPVFPSNITDDLLNIQDAMVLFGIENKDAIAMAFSFILNKYNTGVELLKSNNGNFEPIVVLTPDQIKFSTINCPQ